MTVRSKQLAAREISNATPVTIYSVPAGFRTIVKSVLTRNSTASALAVAFEVMNGGTRKAYFAVWLGAFPSSGDSAVTLPWLVLETGDSLRVTMGSGGGEVIASGAELLL